MSDEVDPRRRQRRLVYQDVRRSLENDALAAALARELADAAEEVVASGSPANEAALERLRRALAKYRGATAK